MSAYLHNYPHHRLRIIILQTWFKTQIHLASLSLSLFKKNKKQQQKKNTVYELQIPFGDFRQTTEHSQKLPRHFVTVSPWGRREIPPRPRRCYQVSPHKDNTGCGNSDAVSCSLGRCWLQDYFNVMTNWL